MENNKESNKESNNWKVTVITAFFTLVLGLATAWFAYNQNTKDKMTDLKIEQLKQDKDNELATNNRHIAIIYGELWSLMLKLDADRCFIIQPHPEHKHIFLSVAHEVARKGISPVKDIFQNIPISDMASFTKDAATNVWIYYDDVDKQVNDKKALSMMNLSGSTQICIRQLVNAKNSWIGNLVIENIDIKSFNRQESMEIITNTANTIQFILPTIN